jgi:CheY-like chemotaxis protein
MELAMTIVDRSNQVKASRLNILVVLTDMPMPVIDGYQVMKQSYAQRKSRILIAITTSAF